MAVLRIVTPVRGSPWICEKLRWSYCSLLFPLTNSYSPFKCQFSHHFLQEAFPSGRVGHSHLSIFTALFMQWFLTCLAGAGGGAYLCWFNSKLPQGTDLLTLFSLLSPLHRPEAGQCTAEHHSFGFLGLLRGWQEASFVKGLAWGPAMGSAQPMSAIFLLNVCWVTSGFYNTRPLFLSVSISEPHGMRKGQQRWWKVMGVLKDCTWGTCEGPQGWHYDILSEKLEGWNWHLLITQRLRKRQDQIFVPALLIIKTTCSNVENRLVVAKREGWWGREELGVWD